MNKTVYGVYESNAEVIQAINALKAKGFEGDDITVVADKEETLDFTNTQRETDVHTMTNVPNDESFMDKVARFFMPEDTADLSTRLANAGLSNSEAAEHVFDVENGKVLVLVEEGEGHLGTAKDKFTTGRMDTAGTRLDTNSTNQLYNGTEKTDALNKEDVYGVNGHGRELPEDERTLTLREEQLNIDKERVQTGEVVINKEVNEQHKTINVPVEHEEVTVEHRSVSGREANLETGSIEDGETIRIPVVEEKLEVSKKPVVTDEIVIKKHAVQETEQVQDTLKKEDIQLDSTDESIVNEKKATERRTDRF
ncbi:MULTISPECIES: YsnF/AvaK domain-containing protein [Peribacillus]|uniref:YsnF/AvaK domain-containing protein n=1 Tax=Peribacillus TaxID=2675229 RepID=UPI001F4E55F4|nr:MULTISPECIES: YsnF/AvaK domain-containing protein [unclassified Peribacillus]MCK1981795.1 YsnF/AvaK domain-containing protein [Peribacillus sp. Aquil_B1]MCK2011443.1 YsnF/AvaK domain-containing protein [Peribacillus sp. Aquil_B8]